MKYRRKVMRINPDILIGLGKGEGIRTVGHPVPDDARVVHRAIDECGDLLLLVESATFPEVLERMFCPEMPGLTFRMPDPVPAAEAPAPEDPSPRAHFAVGWPDWLRIEASGEPGSPDSNRGEGR